MTAALGQFTQGETAVMSQPCMHFADDERIRHDVEPLVLRLGTGGMTLSDSLNELGVELRRWGVSGRCEFVSLLVFEELVTNVLRHGVRGDLPLRLNAAISPQRHGVRIAIEDDGIAFDPVSAGPVEQQDPLIPGGRGLHLVRSMANALHYERRAGVNLMTAVIAAT